MVVTILSGEGLVLIHLRAGCLQVLFRNFFKSVSLRSDFFVL